MLTNPLRSVLLSLEADTLPINTLRSGQIMQAVVQGKRGATFLQLNDSRVALPPDSALIPGSTVRVEIVEEAQGLQLRVSVPSAAPPHPEPVGVLTELLRQLNALPVAEDAEALLPADLPRREDTLGPLLRVLLTRATLSRDMAGLAALLSEAHEAHALPSALYSLFTSLWGQFSAVDAEGITALLKRLARQQRREARLARAIQTRQISGELEKTTPDPRALLETLTRSESLRAFLRQGKRLADFDALAARILDRLSGTQYQNLHGRGVPYFFLEVPFPGDSGIRRAQVHFLEEGGDTETPPGKTHVIAFDLETEHLGALWVTLRVTNKQCACHLRAVSSGVIQALRGATRSLVDALDGAGYENTRVRVSRWDGDRVREVIALSRRFTGLNLSG